jgi:hypothetical protein
LGTARWLAPQVLALFRRFPRCVPIRRGGSSYPLLDNHSTDDATRLSLPEGAQDEAGNGHQGQRGHGLFPDRLVHGTPQVASHLMHARADAAARRRVRGCQDDGRMGRRQRCSYGYRTAGRIVWSSWLPTSLPQLWTPAPAVSHDEERLACPDADGMQMRRELEMDELTIDRDAMGRLARALAFICGADHPTTVALKAAAETGAERDIKNARALFLRLKQSDRRAALAMLDT